MGGLAVVGLTRSSFVKLLVKAGTYDTKRENLGCENSGG